MPSSSLKSRRLPLKNRWNFLVILYQVLEFQKSHRERLAANIEKKVRSICTSVEKKMIDPFPLYMFYSCEDPARAASFLPFDSCLFLRARESYLKLNVLCSSCANVSNHIWVSLSVTARKTFCRKHETVRKLSKSHNARRAAWLT